MARVGAGFKPPAGAFTQRVYALAVTYWMVPRLWLTAGLGSARLKDAGAFFENNYAGSAYMTGIGYEVWSRERYAVNLTLRLITSSFDAGFTSISRTAFAIGLGASWH